MWLNRLLQSSPKIKSKESVKLNSENNPLKLRRDVKLEPLNLKQAPNMYRWISDPIIANGIGLRSEPSLEKTRKWITNTLKDPTMLAFGIFSNKEHIGTIHFDRYDEYLEIARLAIVYLGEPRARGNGLGFTSYYLAISAAFKHFSLNKIWTTVHELNWPALTLNSKMGMRLEGILRDEFKLQEKYINLLYLGLLRQDFEKISVE